LVSLLHANPPWLQHDGAPSTNNWLTGYFGEVFAIYREERRPLFRQIVFEEDRLHRANLGADSAVNALIGIDEVLPRAFVTVNAIDWTNIDARTVLYPNTWLRDDIGHEFVFPSGVVPGFQPAPIQPLTMKNTSAGNTGSATSCAQGQSPYSK
jgi:hypothetical protein